MEKQRWSEMESCCPAEEGEARALVYRTDEGHLYLYVNGQRILTENIEIATASGGSTVRVTLPGEFVRYSCWPALPPGQPK